MFPSAKARWLVLALLVAVPPVIVSMAAVQRSIYRSEHAGTSEPNLAQCNVPRMHPRSISGLEHVVSIAYNRESIAAVDSDGRLWLYSAFPSSDCVGEPKRAPAGHITGE